MSLERSTLPAAFVVAAALLAAGCAAIGTRSARDAGADREILLTVEQTGSVAFLTGAPDSRYLRRRGYGTAPREVDRVLDQLARDHGIERKEGWPIRSLDAYCEVFVVPEGLDVAAVIERLRADPRVDLAQPMNYFEALAAPYDDPYVDLQPAARALGLEAAHLVATGRGVRVAVIDSAVDAKHPDLEGRVRIERDLVSPRRRPSEAEVHGTAVAGVIASVANNREGIVGIAPDAEIASLRACWSDTEHPGSARCSSFTLAQALEAAIDVDAAIVNLSLAGPDDELLAKLLDEAAERGIVVVAAEPLAAGPETAFPSSHPRVIVARAASAPPQVPDGLMRGAVAAVRDDGGAEGARRLPAPAEEILTTTPGAGYAFFSGTSLAAAHVTGVIALVLERAPSLDARRIADVLAATAVLEDGRASVNACRALGAVAGERVSCGAPVAATARQLPTIARPEPPLRSASN